MRGPEGMPGSGAASPGVSYLLCTEGTGRPRSSIEGPLRPASVNNWSTLIDLRPGLILSPIVVVLYPKFSLLISLSWREWPPFILVAVLCVSVLALPGPMGLLLLHILPCSECCSGTLELLLLLRPFDEKVDGVSGAAVLSKSDDKLDEYVWPLALCAVLFMGIGGCEENMDLSLSSSTSGSRSLSSASGLDRLSNENSKLSTTLSLVVLDQLSPCECLG